MLRFWLIILLLVIFLLLPSFQSTPSNAKVSYVGLMKAKRSYLHGRTYHFHYRPSWSRDMSVKTWSKGTENALILITSPVRNKGKVFLKRKKDILNWIPSIDRNIKLPPSMMMQWWMGSDFTNDDLIKESSLRIKRSLGLQRGKVTSGSPGTNSNLPVFSRHVV